MMKILTDENKRLAIAEVLAKQTDLVDAIRKLEPTVDGIEIALNGDDARIKIHVKGQDHPLHQMSIVDIKSRNIRYISEYTGNRMGDVRDWYTCHQVLDYTPEEEAPLHIVK